MNNLGELFPLKPAFGGYMARWYSGLYGDTQANKEFVTRGAGMAIKMLPGRMIDDVEAMLKSYQRDQQGEHGKNAKLPIVFVAMARDYTATSGDAAGRQVVRRLVRLTDEPNASVYGLRLAMHDVRTQIAIIAAEEVSARGLAAQFGLFVSDLDNRRMVAKHTFGQYTITANAMIENPDVMFSSAGDSKTMTILICDITIKATVPYLDAPKPGEPNDGTQNDPPGYPVLSSVSVQQASTGVEGVVDGSGTTWRPAE